MAPCRDAREDGVHRGPAGRLPGGLPALRQGRGWDHHHRGEQLTSLKNKHSKFSFWRAIILVNLSNLVYIYNV